MPPTQYEEIFWILYFVGKKKADRFQRLPAPVDVVTQEQVVCFGRISATLEDSQKFEVLAIDIAANLNLQEAINEGSKKLQTRA